jgi:hypothetical protein
MFGITHSAGEFQLIARGEFRYNLKPLSPGILLQIMFDGRATTDETDLQYKTKI